MNTSSSKRSATQLPLRRSLLASGSAAVLFATPFAFAADAAWSNAGGGGGSWSSASAWTPAAAPGAIGTTNNTDTATLDTSTRTINSTITVDAGRNIGNITFISNTNAFGYSLSSGSLILSAGGTIQTQVTNGGNGATGLNINTGMTLQGDYTFTADGARMQFNSASANITLGAGVGNSTVTIGGTYSTASNLQAQGVVSNGANGVLSIVKTGTGSWQFNGANTFSGGVTVKNGFFGVGGSAAAGTGTLTLGDSSGSNNASAGFGSNVNPTNAISVAAGSSGTLSLTRTGGSGPSTLSGPITLANNLTISQNANNGQNFTFSGAFSGTGNVSIKPLVGTGTTTLSNTSINFTGLLSNDGVTTSATSITGILGSNVTGVTQNSSTSTLTLSNVNTYAGPTTVNVGTLTVSGTGSIANTSGIIVASGATFNKTSSVALSRSFTLAEGAIVTGSGITATGVNVTADLANGFSTIAASFAQGGNLRLDLTNTAEGTYSIFSGSSGSFSGVYIGSTSLSGSGVFSGNVGGFSYAFTDATDSLVISAIPEPSSAAALAGLAAFACFASRRRRV